LKDNMQDLDQYPTLPRSFPNIMSAHFAISTFKTIMGII
jgi:hypothetical protein